MYREPDVATCLSFPFLFFFLLSHEIFTRTPIFVCMPCGAPLCACRCMGVGRRVGFAHLPYRPHPPPCTEKKQLRGQKKDRGRTKTAVIDRLRGRLPVGAERIRQTKVGVKSDHLFQPSSTPPTTGYVSCTSHLYRVHTHNM